MVYNKGFIEKIIDVSHTFVHTRLHYRNLCKNPHRYTTAHGLTLKVQVANLAITQLCKKKTDNN